MARDTFNPLSVEQSTNNPDADYRPLNEATVMTVVYDRVDAGEIIPSVTSGPLVNGSEAGTSLRNFDTLDFDGAAAEFACFARAVPANIGSGYLTARFSFTNDSGSGGVTWKISAIVDADGSLQTTAYGSMVAAPAKAAPGANTIAITDWTPTLNVPSGVLSAGNPIQFRIQRDPADAGDTLAADARLLSVTLRWNPT